MAWGRGSSIPFSSRAALADAVVGTAAVPGPAACFMVAGALAAAAVIVEDRAPLPASVRRHGLWTVGGILALRGLLGVSGHTEVIAPGSASARFVRLDRLVYGPLCVVLAVGTLGALRRSPRQPE